MSRFGKIELIAKSAIAFAPYISPISTEEIVSNHNEILLSSAALSDDTPSLPERKRK